MERVAVDILGPLPITEAGNCYIQVAMDYVMKWPEAYVVADQRASTAMQCLTDEMFTRFWVLDKLLYLYYLVIWLFAEVCQWHGLHH